MTPTAPILTAKPGYPRSNFTVRKQTHLCSNGGSWRTCTACRGRIHDEKCTTRKNKTVDCCLARHKMLYVAGIFRGIDDSSVPMLGGYEAGRTAVEMEIAKLKAEVKRLEALIAIPQK